MLCAKSLSRIDLINNRRADLVAKEHLANYKEAPCRGTLTFATRRGITFGWPRCTDTFLKINPTGLPRTLALFLETNLATLLMQTIKRCTLGGHGIQTGPATQLPLLLLQVTEGLSTARTGMLPPPGSLTPTGPNFETSFLELAAQAFVDGVHFVPKKDEPECLQAGVTGVSILRTIITAAGKRDLRLCPGSLNYAAVQRSSTSQRGHQRSETLSSQQSSSYFGKWLSTRWYG